MPGITRNPRPNRSCFLRNDYLTASYLGAVVVLPLVLPPMPLLPLALPLVPGRGAGCAGVVGLVVELPEPVELEEPAPALARSSRRHFS